MNGTEAHGKKGGVICDYSVCFRGQKNVNRDNTP